MKLITKAKATLTVKKSKAQLEGVELAEQILNSIVYKGLKTLNDESEKMYLTKVNELGNYRINGLEELFIELINIWKISMDSQDFTDCINLINYMFSVIENSKTYLNEKIDDYINFANLGNKSMEMRLKSNIEEQLGTVWKLYELEDLGLTKENVKLVQVAFNVYENNIKKQFIDVGIWIEVETGTIYKTCNFRSYKSKVIKAEDTIFESLIIPKLYIYPNRINCRVEWKSEVSEEIKKEDINKIVSYGRDNFFEVVKELNPLEKSQMYLLKVSNILEDEEGNIAIFDRYGNGIPLELRDFGHIIKHLSRSQVINTSIVCEFNPNIESAIPISIINNNEIIRLQY